MLLLLNPAFVAWREEKNECKVQRGGLVNGRTKSSGRGTTGDFDGSNSKRMVSSRGSNNKHGDLLDTTMRTWTVGIRGVKSRREKTLVILKAEGQDWKSGGKRLVKFGSMGVYGSKWGGFLLCVWMGRLPGRNDGLSGTNKSKKGLGTSTVQYQLPVQ